MIFSFFPMATETAAATAAPPATPRHNASHKDACRINRDAFIKYRIPETTSDESEAMLKSANNCLLSLCLYRRSLEQGKFRAKVGAADGSGKEKPDTNQ